ncbi:MAG: translocation/assembly module TamB domain-containing protein [Pyrinomonadaceae bacterium]
MGEENINQPETEESALPEENPTPPAPRRRFFTRRNFFASFAALAVLVGLLLLIGYLVFRFGYLDNYIKSQFITKMDEIGITFSADTFRTTLSPLTLELKNATFNDKLTGEKLFRIDSAKIGITITDLYSWQLSRDFRVDSTDIDGAEVWVKFDKDGNSNFSNLKFAQEEKNGFVNLNYTSMNFSLKNGLIHFGDVQHKINADAKNVRLILATENAAVPDEQKRYKFDLASTDSNFVYDEKTVEPIDIEAQGIVYREGAQVTQLKLNSPVASSTLSGNIEGWQQLRYNFKIDSTVDLMQAATIFPNGTALRGVGTFSGTVAGEGSKYKIDGAISSDALSADNVRLKGLQINATVEGEGSIYNANGKAIAEMLTFENFKIDYPQMVGNVRGTGTNFKWVGELQAAAARTPAGTLAGLFISDAVAEYEDKKFNATFGSTRAREYSVPGKLDIQNVQARNAKLTSADGMMNAVAPNVKAGSLKTKAIELQGVTASNFKLKDVPARTDIQIGSVQSQSANLKDTKLKNLTAKNARIGIQGGTTTFTANDIHAAQVNAIGASVGGIVAANLNVTDTPSETIVAANNLQVAKIQTNAAILGSLNIAGVRLTVRQGVIEGSSSDINAGDVTLTDAALAGGGKLENVKLGKPVFVLEPSGRYRASMDLSLGGGVLGSINLGAANANVTATNDQVALNNLSADVMDGKISGNAVIALNNRNQSRVDADFSNLDLAKLLALQGGQVIPISGQTTGKANLTFTGTNFRAASGTLVADFNANAGDETRGFVPVNGKLGLRATNGLFNIDYANLNTEKSALNTSGRFDLEGNDSNLQIALNSTDASEVERLIKVLNLSPALEDQLNSAQASFAGNLKFNGNLTGNLLNPTIDGRAALDSINLRGRNLGALTTEIFASPDTIELRGGKLAQPDGGNIAFNVNAPRGGENNIGVQATLTKVNTGNLLAALPFDLPETLKDFNGETSGTIQLSGLPKNISGQVNLASTRATVAGQSFDSLNAKLNIQNSIVNIENFEARSGDGFLRVGGTYNTNASAFDLNLEGKNLQLARLKNLLTKNNSLAITGTVDLTAQAKGNANDPKTFDVNFKGAGQNVTINDNALGTVSFVGTTASQQFNANLTATIGSQPQTITANVNLADPNLPFRAETNFKQTLLEPFIAFLSPPENVSVTGRATGRVYLEGNLSKVDASGNRVFTAADLKGEARFTEFSFAVNETPFIATNPLAIRFNTDEIIVDNAMFSGGGSNFTVSGKKALGANAVNSLAIDGKLNLQVLDVLSKNTFFTGISDISVRLNGTNAEARLTGSAALANASFSTFVGSENISVNRINGRVIFTSNQAQIDQLSGYLGGGKITASGGALLDGLQLERFQLRVDGQNVSAPVIEGLVATGNVNLDIVGERVGEQYDTSISGNINARRAIYTKDIDFADIIGNRRVGGIGEGSSSSLFLPPRLNLTLDGRDALIVRNNIANLTASASLAIAGDTEEPIITGRITANEGGTIFFRNDRYDIQRGVLEFPPSTGEPFINLQAETEIQGYQVFVNLLGDLSNPDNLSATLRSNPALPQPDVVSLITTGNLANTGTGIPTLAQSGINTAAEVITDSLINNPARKATDKLFGLNKFELDPIISGTRVNPGARLTVGRQINRNLAITYSTNLSGDQSQVLALEYRVSNRLSFVAQYQQRSLSNVTRNRDGFGFEIRLRKRF